MVAATVRRLLGFLAGELSGCGNSIGKSFSRDENLKLSLERLLLGRVIRQDRDPSDGGQDDKCSSPGRRIRQRSGCGARSARIAKSQKESSLCYTRSS